MSTVSEIGSLLGDLPPRPGVWPSDEARVQWYTRKAELLSRIADEAAEAPGLVDAAEARHVAEAAWRQVEQITAELSPNPKGT